MAARKEREPAPPEQLAELARVLAAGKELPRAVLVRGEERWFRTSALEKIIAAARSRNLELARHDAADPDFTLRALCDDLAAAPMFASARCVVVKNANQLMKKEGGDDAPFVRAAAAFLGDRAVEGMLVVEAESLRADSILAKAITSAGGTTLTLRRLWDTPPPWDPDPRKTELMQWLLARARERSIELCADDALYVAAATGNDLAALDGALERLSRRGSQTVRGAVGWSAGGSPFQVAEDLCRGDGPRAVFGLEALFRAGFQDRDGSREQDVGALLAVLFSALRSKLRQTLAGAMALENGLDLAAAASEAGVPGNPKARSEFEARVRARASAEWSRMLAALAVLERKSRSGATVDASDLVLFAMSWTRRAVEPVRGARPAASSAPAGGHPGARPWVPRGSSSSGGSGGRPPSPRR